MRHPEQRGSMSEREMPAFPARSSRQSDWTLQKAPMPSRAEIGALREFQFTE
jgi:hypothetical protein